MIMVWERKKEKKKKKEEEAMVGSTKFSLQEYLWMTMIRNKPASDRLYDLNNKMSFT
ncbi:hypothetical protein ACHAWU_000164 [Discostella pseudostelligera]|uniref:Uncharacterized protein n=1 Tax=Discostella pseudostelligera TaxID=259834 RepID=A0ABD3MXE9_9STRA